MRLCEDAVCHIYPHASPPLNCACLQIDDLLSINCHFEVMEKEMHFNITDLKTLIICYKFSLPCEAPSALRRLLLFSGVNYSVSCVCYL